MKQNKLDEMMKNEIDPKCFNDKRRGFALTNRGELIPCCWADGAPWNKNHPTYQKLVKVSKIADYDSINEILMTDEWIEFAENLSKGKGMPVCHQLCQKSVEHKKQYIK
jgi:hypothetical protein